ncbi:MAG TPA: hypothetical protein VK086_04060 [Ruania sp.]|nr:hypothetical protein [Ruania sp.]
MMDLHTVRHTYEAAGPFATVYLEGRSPGEDAAQQVWLRWNDLREQLAEAGAGQATLDHVGEALDPQTTGDARVAGEVQTDGRVLVANDSGVVLDEPWDAALGAGDSAQWSAAPDLGPLLREQAQSVRLLVAITDKQGATVQRVVAAPAHDLEQGNEDAVDGTGHGSGHQPRRGALSHKQIQRHAQEVVQQNQRDIADHLARVATRWHPERIVLGGPVEARTALRQELPDSLQNSYVELEAGGLDDERAQEILADHLRDLAEEISQERAQSATEHFEMAQAHGQAVAGAAQVMRAAQLRAVHTLFLQYGRQAPNEADVLAAAAQGDSALAVIDTAVTDGIGASLRFDLPEETT